MFESGQMERFSDKELLEQKDSLDSWIRLMLREGASPTLMEQALDMVNREIKRRGLNETENI